MVLVVLPGLLGGEADPLVGDLGHLVLLPHLEQGMWEIGYKRLTSQA